MRRSICKGFLGLAAGALLVWGCMPTEPFPSDPKNMPAYLKDRGTGTPTSMFATYCRRKELLVYPFFEHYRNKDEQYTPEEFGFVLDQDFEGRYRQDEYLIFVGYGITDDIAIEFEAAPYTEATQRRDPNDPTAMPAEISEDGLGDVQMQVNWRWKRETKTGPGVFSYFEIGFPTGKGNLLIGEQDWEFKLGTGVIRGFSWGTMIGRLAIEYAREDEEVEIGELAVEYVKRLSPHWRIYLGLEGDGEELEGITEIQWHLSDRVFIKFNNAFGLTPETVDWAPEYGVVLSFPLGGSGAGRGLPSDRVVE